MTKPKLPPVPPNLGGIGISWFNEADWPRWLAIDPGFQPSYQRWLDRMEFEIDASVAKVVER